MKILQQSRLVFTSGSDTPKFAPHSLSNLIIVVVYVLKISLSRLMNFVLRGCLYSL